MSDDPEEQRQLRELLDRQRVGALVDRYVNTLDGPGDLDEEWARSLFTADVRLEHEVAVLQGIGEVAAAHRLVMARWERTLHFSTNHHIEFDADRARLTARLMAIHVHPGEQPQDPLIAANVMDADAVRTGDGWRFQRLALRTIWKTGETAAIAGADGR